MSYQLPRNNNEYREVLGGVSSETEPEVVLEILRQATSALNHEDELYIPAIKYAMRCVELHGKPDKLAKGAWD
mgnify:CR=1